MKKNTTLLLLLIICIPATSLFAQDTLKEGKITMAITYPDANNKDEFAEKFTGDTETIFFKNGSVRNQVFVETSIYNKPKNESYRLVNKQVIFLSSDDLKQDSYAPHNKPAVELTGEKKTILGYPCQKAVLTYTKQNTTHQYDCWFTTCIDARNPVPDLFNINCVDGFPMEITIYEMKSAICFKVTSVEKITVPDSLFTIPAGYPVKTMQQLMEQVKGYGQNNNVTDTATNHFTPLAFGTTFPEIKLNNVNGKPIKLSSLRGKYVLVDFWASWCGPCRAQNPNIVAAYNKYKDKGFTVYSISLDNEKDRWQQAIKQDSLTWPNHVCDYLSWASPVAKQFNLNGIPFSYLLDKDGKVVAFDLRDTDLENILSKNLK